MKTQNICLIIISVIFNIIIVWLQFKSMPAQVFQIANVFGRMSFGQRDIK